MGVTIQSYSVSENSIAFLFQNIHSVQMVVDVVHKARTKKAVRAKRCKLGREATRKLTFIT